MNGFWSFEEEMPQRIIRVKNEKWIRLHPYQLKVAPRLSRPFYWEGRAFLYGKKE